MQILTARLMRFLEKALFTLAAFMILIGSLSYFFGSTEFVNSVGQIVYDSTNGYLYATSSNGLLAINGTTNSVVKTIPLPNGYSLGSGRGDIVFDPQNGYIYAYSEGYKGCLFSPCLIQVIDGQNNTIIGNISEEYNFGALYFNPSNGYVYFGSNNGLNTINSSTDAVENVTITPKIWNQIDPASIAYDPLSKSLYLGNSVVEIINSTNVFAKEVQTGGDSISIVFDSINGYMYVADDAYACAPNDNCTTGPRGSVSIISATSNTLVSALNFTSSMSGLADDSQNGNVLVAIYGNTSVIIDGTTNTILASIPSCSSAVFDPANGNFYATSSQGISVISGSSNKIVDTISLVQVTPADYYLVALPLTVGGVLLASGFILVTKRRKSSNVDSSLSTVASASVIKRPLGITFLDTTQLFLMNSYFQTTLESIGHYVKIDRIRMPPLLFCAGIQYLSLLRFLCRNVGRHNGSLFPFIFRIDEKFSSARESLMDYLRALAILLGHMSIRTIL